MKAEDFARDNNIDMDYFTVTHESLMIDFAKYHVAQALKEAAKRATMKVTYSDECYADSEEFGLTYASAHEIERGGENGSVEIESDSILNAYSLDNIK